MDGLLEGTGRIGVQLGYLGFRANDDVCMMEELNVLRQDHSTLYLPPTLTQRFGPDLMNAVLGLCSAHERAAAQESEAWESVQRAEEELEGRQSGLVAARKQQEVP